MLIHVSDTLSHIKIMEYVHVNDGKEEELDGLVLGIDENFVDIIDIKKYIHFNVLKRHVSRHLEGNIRNCIVESHIYRFEKLLQRFLLLLVIKIYL